MRRFIFHNPGRLIFGEGSAAKMLPRELSALGARRPFLVSDEVVAETEMAAVVKEALGPALAGMFTAVVPDTGIDIIDRAVAEARAAGADALVSLGGGSSIDTAKAVAAALGMGVESVAGLIGMNKLTRPPFPHIALPTTAGTGSECTSMAVIKDRAAGKKVILLDSRLIPSAGILDPLFTASMPKGITAATGMDAMTHAAEAIMSKNAMPPADALALHAIGLIVEALPRAVADGNDLEARSMMLVAAAEAGQAFQNALVGIVHAMAHALGGLAGLPHGLANGILLWVGMEFNAAVVPERVALIGKAMGVPQSGNAGQDAVAAVEAVRSFAERVEIPLRLKMAGVDPACLADVAQLALADPSLLTNPRQPGEASEIQLLLEKCM